MLQGVGIICFSMSYLIGFALELVRSRQTQKDQFQFLILLATISGCVAHSAYLGNNFLFQNMRIISGMQGWFLLLAWGLILFYLYYLIFYPHKQFGLFIFPLVFLLIAGSISVENSFFSEQTTFQLIRGLHGISLLIATLLVLIGFVTGGMYFMQKSRLRRKSFQPGNFWFPNVMLPTLEWLQIANRRSVKLSVVFLGMGVLSGYYLNFQMTNIGPHSESICDAMIVGTTLFFLLLILLLFILSWTKRLNDGRKMALLTIFCFLFLLVILLIGIFSQKSHWNNNQTLTRQEIRLIEPDLVELPESSVKMRN